MELTDVAVAGTIAIVSVQVQRRIGTFGSHSFAQRLVAQLHFAHAEKAVDSKAELMRLYESFEVHAYSVRF